MESDLLLTNLNTIKEMILDEEKLVTYITVSKDLCMHVNNSKKLLCSVIKKIREEQPNTQLNINYIISGMQGDNSAIVTICTETELHQLRKTLKIKFFDHVYSVCKGSSVVDTAALLILNKFEDFSLCIGSLKSNECDKRTIDEIGNLKTNSQEALILQSKPVVVTDKVFKQETKHDPVEDIHEKAKDIKSVKKVEIKIKTETIKDEISRKESSVNIQSKQIMNGNKTQKGIASFFNKTNGVQNKKAFNNSRENKLNGKTGKLPQIEEEKVNVPKDDSVSENLTYNENPIALETTKTVFQSDKEMKYTKTGSEVKDKVKNKVKKSLKADKKRKRVVHISDSESDEEKDQFLNKLETNPESDEEIPPTPLTNNNIKLTSGFINPKKRRKVIDKTYTDENGYMLTKKEEVYESCSENEDVMKTEIESKSAKEVQSNTSPTIKKNSPTKEKKKISPPQKGKQQTLNNFFHRK